MRLLLYGGTFDPPHNGHLNNLRAAAARVRPDRVVVMPAGLSPFKQSTAAPGSARVEMCACFRALEAEGAVPALCVSGWEVEQAALAGATIRCSRWKCWPGLTRRPSCTWPWAAICC